MLITITALLILWFALQKESDQPEDGPWKGRNMSLREAMYEHLSNKSIKQVEFDYILPIYFMILFIQETYLS